MERREVLSSMLFIQAIEGAKEELSAQQTFLEEAIKDPHVLFSRGTDRLGKKSLVSYIMNGFVFNDGKLLVHDFQVFLADLTDRFVQEWAKSNGITESIKVEVRMPNSYPSIFAIYHKEMELIQFNVLEKFYGVRNKVKDEETIRFDYKKLVEQIEEHTEPLLVEVADYERLLNHPHQYIREHYKSKRAENIIVIGKGKTKKKYNYKNLLKLPLYELSEHCSIFFKKRSFNDKLKVKIENAITMIESEKRVLSRYPSIEELIEKNRIIDDLTKKLIPMFEEFDYYLEIEKHKLY
jgi:hypothetical protein